MPLSASDVVSRSSEIVRTCSRPRSAAWRRRRAAVRQGGEVALRDLEVLEDDPARDLVDLGPRGREHHAEALLLAALGHDRQRRTELDLVAHPPAHLWLVHQHRAVGQVDLSRPRVRRKACRGRGARGRRRRAAPRVCATAIVADIASATATGRRMEFANLMRWLSFHEKWYAGALAVRCQARRLDSSWLTCAGLALPWVAFITWPTRALKALSFSGAELSTDFGFLPGSPGRRPTRARRRR